ncbi:MAG: thioredoxin domain-containing protein [Verrucomicrobia bacterium]|nr:thioredoxin domain-containing protein [Verrucomicrobiota bacterium]
MPNALAHEKSPYLRQHADNPVAWLPWGEAAFARARAEDKPIFLSIGYSTCHWCHVMAHESFESEAIAALLNEHFVSIKVDREERPDVDKVYMTYVQSLTGHGGWPLSAWLTPELKPFYGGTYFPPEDRQGRAGFPSLLRAIAAGWAKEREKLIAESERVLGALREHQAGRVESSELSVERTESGSGAQRSTLSSELAARGGEAFEKCFQHFYENFDAANGGFGGAPKFPRASNLSFLLRVAAIQGSTSEIGAEAIKMTAATLRAMARGGIHDHVGGGFHRYSVDDGWFVPHFEKMLYDQAQIALNCLEARQATGDERFAWLARDIFAYVARDLTSPAGGFFSAEDADSEIGGTGRPTREDLGRATHATQKAAHAEGAFYVWEKRELVERLGPDAAWFCAHFGVEETGNVPAHLDPHGEFRGKNILMQRRSLAETAQAGGIDVEAANERLLAALAQLDAVRARRPRPHLDDKIITAWNGLMISALARGAVLLEGRSLLAGDGKPGADESPASRLLPAAIRAAEFVERELWDAGRGVLFRCWREGRGAAEGFAEDYAYFTQALLDLYEASFEVRWLQWADALQTKMDELFWDEERGGYFNSAAGDPHLVLRLKEDYDGAEPAPSSVAALNLLRLGTIFHDEARRERGARCIAAFRGQWMRAPHALPQMLCALEPALDPPRHVVLAGDAGAPDFRALAAVLHEKPGPRRAMICLPFDRPLAQDVRRWWIKRLPWLEDMQPIEGRATAYVCEDYTCQQPATSAAELRRRLGV